MADDLLEPLIQLAVDHFEATIVIMFAAVLLLWVVLWATTRDPHPKARRP